MPEAADRRHGSFFGRRKGHKLRAHQLDLIEQLLPRLALDINGAAPADLGRLFDRPLVRSDSRSDLAAANIWWRKPALPDTGFIGCEPYVNGMAKIMAQIEAHNITNIRLFAGDAAELLAWLPPRSLARIDLIHPDPWPKRRHWKRRFVQDATVAAMARVLKPAANFASSAISTITAPGRWRICCARPISSGPRNAPSDWRLPWDGYTMTRYGRKAEREGREAAYLRFRRAARATVRWLLPEVRRPRRGRAHQPREI